MIFNLFSVRKSSNTNHKKTPVVLHYGLTMSELTKRKEALLKAQAKLIEFPGTIPTEEGIY